MKIEKLEIAIAGFVLKLKKAITIGTEMPPPPIPAILERAFITEKTTMPPYSKGFIGKTFL